MLAFDTYHNASEYPVPYVAVGRGETALWEQPWLAINTSISALASVGSSITHDYNVSTDSGKITVSLDGVQILAGDVSVPSIAYFYVTSSAGGKSKNLVISNMSNGAGITGSWNVHAGWSVVAEFSSEFRPSSSSQGSLAVFSFLGGARYRLPQPWIKGPHRPQPFAQVLIGPAHSGSGQAGSGDHTYAFAVRLGGGIDVPLKSHFELRAIQIDWFLTQFANAKNDRQNNLLVATGITYHWSFAKK